MLDSRVLINNSRINCTERETQPIPPSATSEHSTLTDARICERYCVILRMDKAELRMLGSKFMSNHRTFSALVLLLVGTMVSVASIGCGVTVYRRSITSFTEASTAALDSAEEYARSISTNKRKDILYERIYGLYDVKARPLADEKILLQSELEPKSAEIHSAEEFAGLMEAIKVARDYVVTLGAVAGSDAGKVAADSVQDIGGAVIRLRIMAASSQSPKLDSFARHGALISSSIALLTEKVIGLAIEKQLDKAITKAAPSFDAILTALRDDVALSHQIARQLAGTRLQLWLAEFESEARRLKSTNGPIRDVEALARIADNIVSAIEERDALKVAKPTAAINKLIDAHNTLHELARSTSKKATLEDFEKELDDFLARARGMNEALKSYREAIANRPEATPTEREKLSQALTNLLIGRLKEASGVGDLEYP